LDWSSTSIVSQVDLCPESFGIAIGIQTRLIWVNALPAHLLSIPLLSAENACHHVPVGIVPRIDWSSGRLWLVVATVKVLFAGVVAIVLRLAILLVLMLKSLLTVAWTLVDNLGTLVFFFWQNGMHLWRAICLLLRAGFDGGQSDHHVRV
jgi:hypothetical protein